MINKYITPTNLYIIGTIAAVMSTWINAGVGNALGTLAVFAVIGSIAKMLVNLN